MQEDYKSKIQELVESGLNKNSCVLFIGPEFIKVNGQDCNLAFYNALPDNDKVNLADKQKARYDASEKIWHFDSKTIKANFCIKFENFLIENRDEVINNPVFHKLASIPFPLIVSLIPDNTLEEAFKKYENFDFSFKSFMSDSNIEEPSPDHLLIYNIYGNISGGYYVASHFDYLKFIMDYLTTGFPIEFKSAIIKARYLVFIGFQLDKWYNILLLNILNRINGGAQNCAIEEQSAEELYKKLSGNDLNLFFIEKNGEEFINDLYNNKKLVLRKIIPLKEYVKRMIQSVDEAIVRTKLLIGICENPKEKLRLTLDLEILEKDRVELMNRLKGKGK